MSRKLALAAALCLIAPTASAEARTLTGTKRADRLIGTAKADVIRGGRGRDRIDGRGGADRLYGGSGRDLLRANDGRRDRRIDGGPGRDTCVIDRRDRRRVKDPIRRCERVLVRKAAAKAPPITRVPGSARRARSFGIWSPGRFDSCSKALHDRYATLGPDGRLYPGWHPPVVRDPATGRTCTFGHEHGRDPRGSDIYGWVASHMGGGVPFGAANEALDGFAAANPGTPTRHEDHVGHKIEWEDDVELERSSGGGRVRIGVRCDWLTKVHQGTHSADAFGNNLHELLYAVRCDDGTALIATKLVSFARADSFTRSCDKTTRVFAGTAHPLPDGPGARFIPDRECVTRHLLVPPPQFSDFSGGLYEDWISANYLRTAGGRQIAYFDPHFAVFNPSRVFDAARPGRVGRSLDACFETEGNGDRAAGGACDVASANGTRSSLPWDHPASPFDGAHREAYFNQTSIENAGGPARWYTDPFGGRASSKPFPGALCQLVGRVDNSKRPTLESQAFGASRPYTGSGVHAPN